MNNDLMIKLKEILPENSIKLQEELKNHTTFKIGGPCKCMLFPQTEDELIDAIRLLKSADERYFVMGRGSNLLFADEGFEAVVINLSDNFSNIKMLSENEIEVLSGSSLKDVAYFAYEKSLSGLEFASGIPGAIGGAVFMNAGAYIGEMKDVVKSVKVLDENLNVRVLNKDELGFSYRMSNIQKYKYIVISAVLELKQGVAGEILEVMQDLEAKRSAKQPLEMPSAGSAFKRPEGYYAGKLIQDSGLKGIKFGGAMVSSKHSGFIVNYCDATASDVLGLIDIVRKTVFDNFGVMLEPEIRLMK